MPLCYGSLERFGKTWPDLAREVVENLLRHPKVAYASYKDRWIIGYPEMTQARFLVHLHMGISQFFNVSKALFCQK